MRDDPNDPNNPYSAAPEAIFALLDVLNVHQVRQLADLLHQIKNAEGRGEVSIQLNAGFVRYMVVKLSLDAKGPASTKV